MDFVPEVVRYDLLRDRERRYDEAARRWGMASGTNYRLKSRKLTHSLTFSSELGNMCERNTGEGKCICPSSGSTQRNPKAKQKESREG